ncbi:MAG: 4-alpha-glucanotransferase [Oscillospiraceae bacterium]|nr:4-alpha-glucanotransferase [Oscillospiraceae bacterium]
MKRARASGVLLAISALPGPYGIGSLGEPARRFVDFLARARQRWWQILPLVPLGNGASPYMSPSAFAGNPLLIDLDLLAGEGLLTQAELDSARCENLDRVDYSRLNSTRLPLLRLAWQRAKELPACPVELPWLEDYAVFSALHDKYRSGWWEWPRDAVPDPEEMDFHRFLQHTFYRQWFTLKQYANEKGVHLMGDIPIYLSADSVELWRRPEVFELKADGRPSAVAGVPPDAFCPDGQLWGNPLYNWNQQETFDFWKARIGWCAKLYDAVRIDHFRAFHNYWAVPADAETAATGQWLPGPGRKLLDALQEAAPELELIAEDLGDLDAGALEFVSTCGVPGMRVLVFAFTPGAESAFLPHNCGENCVVYTGTHDTPTFVQWLTEADAETAAYARAYLRLREEEGLGWGGICGAWGTRAYLAIAPMQDVLGLGADARMNTPGTIGDHNWSWRVRQEAFNDGVADHLARLTEIYSRAN